MIIKLKGKTNFLYISNKILITWNINTYHSYQVKINRTRYTMILIWCQILTTRLIVPWKKKFIFEEINLGNFHKIKGSPTSTTTRYNIWSFFHVYFFSKFEGEKIIFLPLYYHLQFFNSFCVAMVVQTEGLAPTLVLSNFVAKTFFFLLKTPRLKFLYSNFIISHLFLLFLQIFV